MEETKLLNGTTKTVAPIQYIEEDRKKECGGNEVSTPTNSFFQHQKPKTISSKEIEKEKSLSSEEARKMFYEKFKERNVNYEELFEKFEWHCKYNGRWPMLNRWLEWIDRERVDNYEKKATHSPNNRVLSPFTEEEEEIIRTYKTATAYGDRTNVFFKSQEEAHRAKILFDNSNSLREVNNSVATPKNGLKSLSSILQSVQQRQFTGMSA
jgi:hypothetical protein